MADRKTMTRQTLIGEKGIELISRRCLQMGYLFHPRRVDHGIDGHIDLVEADTGAVLNLTLLVQSKAQDRPFQGENADAFRYLCDQRDLDMWLSGNAPVILVFSHPKQEEAWWVEVKAAFPDATARAKRTIFIDKRTQRFDRDAAAALMDLAVPKDAGLYLRPPSITEILTTNLLLVAEMPASLFVATSRFGSDYRAAGEALAGTRDAGIRLDTSGRHGLLLRQPARRAWLDPVRGRRRGARDGGVGRKRRPRHALPFPRPAHPGRAGAPIQSCAGIRTVGTCTSGQRLTCRRGRSVVGPAARGRTVFGPHPAKREPGKSRLLPSRRTADAGFAAWTGRGSANWSRTTASPPTA